MTSPSTEIALPQPAAAPARMGQATAVEQARAVAEVQGAIIVAQQCPRDTQLALSQMRDSCAQTHLAQKAFFRYSRGGSQITGPSVHLARELARCWGNVQYGVKEMRRDDIAGESEMLAFAWDVQTNTRTETTFIVPHKRDKKGGPERLIDLRDIYENNANAAARRVRECIFAVLPPWLTEEAKDLCRKTNADGGGVPLAHRISEALAKYAEMKVTGEQLERKLGRPTGKWTGDDVAVLITIYRSLMARETTVEDEFPTTRVTVEDIHLQAAPVAPPVAPPASAGEDIVGASTHGRLNGIPDPQGDAPKAEQPLVNRAQQTKMHDQLGELGIKERADKLTTLGLLVRRTLSSSSDLTHLEATQVIDILERCLADANPGGALDFVLAELENAGGGA
jgi:hypothetical protein